MTLEDRACNRGPPMKGRSRGDGGENHCGMKGRAQNGTLIVIQSLSSVLTLDKVNGLLFL